MLLQAEGSAQMRETTVQVAGLYQGAQRYCDILQFFLKLVFVMEIYWKFTGMYWENFIVLEEILCKNGISQHEVLKYFSMPYIINF